MRACVFRPASSPVGSSVTTNMLLFNAPSPGLVGEGADRRTRGASAPQRRALLLRLMVRCPTCWLAKLIFAGSALTVAFAPAAEVTAAKTSKPNIVLILADDLGTECLGSYGGTSYRTPNLDTLARSGIRFENAYCTPLCSPSRVQLMTGRYGFRTGWTNLIGRATPEFFDPKEKTFGHIFKEAGYATAVAGKWQLADFHKHPNNVPEAGFDEYCCWAWVFDGLQTLRYWDPAIWQSGKWRRDVRYKYGEDVFCDFLIDFIKRNRDQPFFVYYPMVLVHAPFEFTPDTPKARTRFRWRSVDFFPDMVAYLDKTVGRLVATLDRLKLREKTLVIFAGDNGTDRNITSKVGDQEIRGGKGTVTHLGTHVPLIASWPGTIPSGQISSDLVDFSDVLPTMAELAGIDLPKGITFDGQSFAPQLLGQPGKPREWVFVQLDKERFVREQRWLLHDDGRLYDIKADPFEQKNLGSGEDTEMLSAKKRLQAVLEKLK